MPKTKTLYSDRDYLEARFSEIMSAIKEYNEENKEIKRLAVNAHTHAEASHKRITNYENRFFGWVIGIGGLGAAGGMTLGETVKSLFKGIGGH